MKTRDLPRHEKRQDRLINQKIHDPYKHRGKMSDPTICPQCEAVYLNGRWRWEELALEIAPHAELCQACHRINDKYPAGWLNISGAFVADNRDDLINLIQHQAELEMHQHPLHRVMNIEETATGLTITFTDIHLPRRIGDALKHAYQGKLDFHYEEQAYQLRVSWHRDL